MPPWTEATRALLEAAGIPCEALQRADGTVFAIRGEGFVISLDEAGERCIGWYADVPGLRAWWADPDRTLWPRLMVGLDAEQAPRGEG